MTPEELQEIIEQEMTANEQIEHTIRVCGAAGCQSLQSEDVQKELEKAVSDADLGCKCKVKCVGCMGLCSAGPLVSIEDKDGETKMLHSVKVEDAQPIVKSLNGDQEIFEKKALPLDQPFFSRQHKVVLENTGEIDPERLEDYVAAGGYSGLIKALTEMSPAEVLAEVDKSGLRGRGGGGFATGLKWKMMAKEVADQKYVICNADEGEPGAFMDRAILESDPHRIIEGMALAGYAVGAERGYVYVRAEYPLAISRLKLAIRKAGREGLLGNNISGTEFNFSIEIRLGAGAFVCGEETALISSIEGKRGQPKSRPPYPTESGLWGCPTMINNVETLANIAPIVRNGGDWYSSMGTESSKGTKVFALAGTIANTGLIEVPMGVSLREIIMDIGGGIPGGKFKAVQTGGPSGGCIPEQFLDMPVDYDSLRKVGSIMGSGGMIVMDETSSMVDVARFFMEFCMSESCGKCIPCRVGTYQMHEILSKIAAGEGTKEDLELLEELCDVVRHTSLCGLGQTSPNPVLSTLKYFHHEYDELIGDKHVPGGLEAEVTS